jgi:hypothetical protein
VLWGSGLWGSIKESAGHAEPSGEAVHGAGNKAIGRRGVAARKLAQSVAVMLVTQVAVVGLLSQRCGGPRVRKEGGAVGGGGWGERGEQRMGLVAAASEVGGGEGSNYGCNSMFGRLFLRVGIRL